MKTTTADVLTSSEVKTKVMCFFRFGGVSTRFPYIATEAGRFNADVLISDGKKRIIEVEVKINASDLRHDFKKDKHRRMRNSWGYFQSKSKRLPIHNLPTQFYFAVPKHLLREAIACVEGTPYGVIGVLSGRTSPRDHGKRWCKVFVKAKDINTFCPRLFRSLVLRSSSELVCLRLAGR